MKIVYKNKELNIKECKSFYDRFMGFMGKRNIDHGLLFNRCSSSHTFFMKEKIDVIMLDKDNNIKYIYKSLGKNKIILPKRNVYKTIELPINYFDFKIDEKLIIKD